VIFLSAALFLSPFQTKPVRSGLEVVLLLLCLPAILFTRRTKNAGLFLIIASAFLALLGSAGENNVSYSFPGAHFFLRWFEIVGAIGCFVLALIEGARRIRFSNIKAK
jgi:hypothetical membrane protein